MINVFSYLGVNLQSEVCLWTLVGLIRTIFDATLFKVNANLKQVWQMNMPNELSRPVQRGLRTMISGVMLVKCFTVYVYLASYIVLLYPVFLEERPTLVLPWLLLAAIRKLLCELTSLALGLGTCVLLGPARPPCIKFLILKVISITPSFYMWLLVLSYYNTLKLSCAFKTFPVIHETSDPDYGLELAVRRRRTKSLFDEEELRKKIIAHIYAETDPTKVEETSRSMMRRTITSRPSAAEDDSMEVLRPEQLGPEVQPILANSDRILSNIGTFEDWFGNEVMIPRTTDRILEQFVLMLLRISAYLRKEGIDPGKFFTTQSLPRLDTMDAPLPPEDTDTPPQVGNTTAKPASYLRNYPQIFKKKATEMPLQLKSDHRLESFLQVHRENSMNLNKTFYNSGMTFASVDTISINRRGSQITFTKDEPRLSLERKSSGSLPNPTQIHRASKELNEKDHILKSSSSIEKTKNDDLLHDSMKTSSVDSIKSVISRMKQRLSASEKFSQDKNRRSDDASFSKKQQGESKSANKGSKKKR